MNQQPGGAIKFGMPEITFVFGDLLIVLGVAGYFLGNAASVTALIPAFFGIVFVILGMAAFVVGRGRQNLRKHLMHAAAALALLCIIVTISGLLKLPALLSGGEVLRPMAVVSQSIMCLLSVIYLVLCVRSFMQARMNKS